MKAFITVIGKDRVGIIHGITSVLKDCNVNVLDIIQTRVESYFTMIMFVDLEGMSTDYKVLKSSLDDAGDKLGVTVKIQHEDVFNSMHKL
ncbi:ACT domain-containing protein [Youngiibacter fragilis]|uniref:UPF0237 protein T472_0207140 n=1 Tax=Youngiibacter fragilis 232.1 TaxID=994573 RepID=V7I7R8_9CLOT|nr:ACT domain-containing protein [Youngiibacter fragilis]ETA81279.1 hypothetical protein T472_0207140 [Youngiibacter fragilis 232.1]